MVIINFGKYSNILEICDVLSNLDVNYQIRQSLFFLE